MRMPLATLLAASALFVGSAHAATICVGISAPACDGSAETLQTALDSAKATAADDRIVLGAGRFVGPFTYLPFTDAGELELVGQGADTVLTAPGPTKSSITVLRMQPDGAEHGAKVANLGLLVPANTEALNPGNIGVRGATAVDGVQVSLDANDAEANSPIGVALQTPGATVANSDIEMSAGSFSVGVLVQAPGEVADTRIHAPVGVFDVASSVTVTRSRIVTDNLGVFACNGDALVEDSLIRVSGFGTGLTARGDNQCSAGQASLTARQVTVVGSGTGGETVGAGTEVGVAGQTPVLDVSLSIVRDVKTAFEAAALATGTATVRVSASDFDAARHSETSAGGGVGIFEQPQPNIDADPLFADALFGDFRLGSGSPAIDSSFSPPLAADESATDLAGNPRIVDGNGDGVAARDMGALEAPEVKPPVDTKPPNTLITKGPKRKVTLRSGKRARVVFRFRSSEAGSRFQCKLDKQRFRVCRSPLALKLKPGLHRFLVRAIDRAGNVDKSPAKRVVKVVRLRHVS